jgi:type III secretory pathway component EscV
MMATNVPELLTSVSNGGVTTRKTPDKRKEALGRAVQRQVSLGSRVESQADYQAILITGRSNRILHLVTLGLSGAEHRTSVSVDESGNTNLQALSR